jgi:hypothetical protein
VGSLRSSSICCLLVALALTLVCRAPAEAQTTALAIPCEDVMLAQAHKQNNFGAVELWVKIGNGINRVLLRCDLTPLAGRASDLLSAVVRLRIQSQTFQKAGTSFSIHAADGSAPPWIEGVDRFDSIKYCQRREFFRPARANGGAGTTWNCAQDPNVRDGKTKGCVGAWAGGFPGHAPAPTDTLIQVSDPDPTCAESLACYAAGGGVDCWRSIEFDVLADVARWLAADAFEAGWLIKQTAENSRGGFFAFSREIAVCVLGISDLRPQLIVTLAEQPGDPPAIPDLPDHCEYVNP